MQQQNGARDQPQVQQSPIKLTGNNYVAFEIFTAVTMKNAVFWDVATCGSCEIRHFGQRVASIISVDRINELGTTLAVTSN
jgi:hypothetical protein